MEGKFHKITRKKARNSEDNLEEQRAEYLTSADIETP